MPNENNYLDITLLGKEYRVACPPSEQDALIAAVNYVDEKMHDIAEKTKSNIAERIAVMAALNIAHEHLSLRNWPAETPLVGGAETEVDIDLVRGRIADMEAQLDAVLAPQNKLL
jgi:cell division protein ZapA